LAREGPPAILDEIVAVKRREVERLKVEAPLSELEVRIKASKSPLNLAGALWGGSVRVIGEVKKASPTRGLLRAEFDPVSLATAYADAGAAAISVLTNTDHFQGSIQDLEAVQEAMAPRGIPVLRKEFIFDPYQVYEARAYGADAVLLIVSILSPDALRRLLGLAQGLWMQCLVEVHDERELGVALDAGAEIVGINNRDLRTFEADLGVTERLAAKIPSNKIVVSESGIGSREDVERLGRAGAHAVLVGEALVTAADPGARLRELV
jgi:indole-3-glycerol phosphate synthase